MDYRKLITRDPKVLNGKPVISGTRISVELIIRKLANGYTIEDLIESYPHLTREQIMAAINYAADIVSNEELAEV